MLNKEWELILLIRDINQHQLGEEIEKDMRAAGPEKRKRLSKKKVGED